MGNPMVDDLVRKMRSGRITRRHFIQSAIRARSLRDIDQLGPPRQPEFTLGQASEGRLLDDPHPTGPRESCRRSSTPSTERTPTFRSTLTQKVGGETDTTALMTAVRGGVGPDVYMLDRFIVAQRAAEGVLQDLSEFMGADFCHRIHPIRLRRRSTFQGKLHLPSPSTPTRALSSYNIAMLQEAGIDPAELDVDNGPITWDRLAELANQLNETDAGRQLHPHGVRAATPNRSGTIPMGSPSVALSSTRPPVR